MATTGETKRPTKLKVGNVYLIKVYNSLQEMYVEKITNTAYKTRKEKTDGTWYIEWVSKKSFELYYSLLEHIDTLSSPPQLETEKVKIEIKNLAPEICPACGGDGYVPDYDGRTTTATKLCPRCKGGGTI